MNSMIFIYKTDQSSIYPIGKWYGCFANRAIYLQNVRIYHWFGTNQVLRTGVIKCMYYCSKKVPAPHRVRSQVLQSCCFGAVLRYNGGISKVHRSMIMMIEAALVTWISQRCLHLGLWRVNVVVGVLI
jgi:hypothetical protein